MEEERDRKSVSESEVAYGTAVTDLQQPIILQQEGQPVAVIISYAEYQHLRSLAVDESLRRSAGWARLETVTGAVHQRPSEVAPATIETEIDAALAEVKRDRDADRRSH